MEIISHRGCWQRPEEKNTRAAFERSFSLGFGTEVDVRDAEGGLVVSHGPSGPGMLAVADVLRALVYHDPRLPLAINVKADGLQALIRSELAAAGVTNYFLFDMSIPDAVQSLEAGLRCFTRQSDLEPSAVLYDRVSGVWMDAFERDSWITGEAIAAHLRAGKEVCLVSPELHDRPHVPFWTRLKNVPFVRTEKRLMLCTDLPEEARRFFAP